MSASLTGRSVNSLGEEVMLLITDSQKANKLQVVGHFRHLQFLLQLKCCWLNLPTSMFLGGVAESTDICFSTVKVSARAFR